MTKKTVSAFLIFLFITPLFSLSVFSQQAVSEVLQPGSDISLTPEEKQYLEDVFKDTWHYISVFVDPATGIPYDSDKKQPATSLSNVGLYIAAAAIAAETGLIGKDEAVTRINMALTSLDKAPDWLGIPRVWISARGLKGIQGTEMFSYSKHVSNFIGGLELVQSVFPEELNATVESWFESMDFSGMYDAKTGWIKGGYDIPHKNFAVSQPFGPWYYKFLASEARLISFYLIAKGFAPASHWKALDRTIQKDGDKWFFVSSYEDGGAYMPYMASLYIDETNTEMGISQKNFSSNQIARAQKAGAPVWGLSASLDTQGEYIPYGQLTDRVVSPYASMLAALHFPKEAAQNLKKLDELGARPNQIYVDRRTNFTAFTKEGFAAKPWAILEDGDVFFLNQSGAIEKLSAYVDWGNRFNEVSNYDKDALRKFLEKMGYRMDVRESSDVYVKKVFGPSAFKSGWQDATGDSEKQKQLLGLASAAGLYFPGWIQFHDGRKAQAAFIEENGVLKPWAIADGDNILFLNTSGEIQYLKPQIEAVNTVAKIKDIEKQTCVVFAPALGINVAQQLESAGCVEYVLPAYTFKDGTAETLANTTEAGRADLIAMGVAQGQMLPAQIKLKLEIPGNFGFRDAYDWENNKVEKHYLTPSQGMGFLALANVLHEKVVQKKFAQDPDVVKGLAVITPSADELVSWDTEAQKCSAPARINPEKFAVS